MKKTRRRIFDRPDGKLLRKLSHNGKIIPFVMPRRVDSTNQYNQNISIDNAEKVLKEVNEEHNLSAGIMDLVITAMVRTISQMPKVNRFIVGKKIYARNDISVSFAVKKDMNENSETTEVKIHFEPTDTLSDVSKKIRSVIVENKGDHAENDQDVFTKILRYFPGFLITFIIGFIKFLDRLGIMPKFVYKISPFHASFFLVNLGSLRIDSVYHHLYEIGTVSWFVGLGKKKSENIIQRDGSVKRRKYMEIRYSIDERITDGYYAANALRLMTKYMNNPKILLDPPKEVVEDNEI
ncbi:2-oxo acid dehydrogenase subunit E2 [Mycoplasmatota bacterium]|nr:2-oxo acid dehydrogenase subunit E2 [Mycoplasmatota bacterium]